MIKKIILPLITAFGGYYYAKNNISLKDQTFISALNYLNEKNPIYSLYLLRAMMQFKFLKFHKQLQKYILVREFDRQGTYLQFLDQLGIGAIQIGPCSLLPTCSQEQIRLLGIGIVKANIFTFRKTQKSKMQPFKIGVNITPNYQIIKYTPYLIKQNILECFQEVFELDQTSNIQQINFVTLNFNNPQLKDFYNEQYVSVVKQAISQAYNKIKSYNQLKKEQVKLFVEFPKQNFQLIKHFKNNSQYSILVLDQNGQIDNSTSKTIISENNLLNKQRITWKQFVKKIIDKTLI